MQIIPEYLEKNLDAISKVLTAISKLSIFIGGLCVVAYSLRIDYFPQDLSVSDGLLFIMSAACFGFVYIFFLACLVSLGITASFFLRIIFKALLRVINFFRKTELFHKRKEPLYELAPFHWIAFLMAIIAIVIIWMLGREDPSIRWTLPFLSLGLYLFYSMYQSLGSKIKKIELIQSYIVHTKEKENIAQLGSVDNLRKAQWIGVGVVLFVPLLIGGVSG